MSETLHQALRRVWQAEWKHHRSGKCLLSQAEKAIAGIYAVWPHQALAADVTQERLALATNLWHDEGLSPATINKRLNCLSKLGVHIQEGTRAKVKPSLKWWLRPEDAAFLFRRPTPAGDAQTLVRFIGWTTHTGLRVEESLHLSWSDFQWTRDGKAIAVTVPGTKTAKSQATLPISEKAASCLSGNSKPFDITYERLNAEWQKIRAEFGWQSEPTCTLKALRRSAARYLHVDCNMPLHMVQQYLRHESLDTTLGYLRLTGGYGTEEMRRYLK